MQPDNKMRKQAVQGRPFSVVPAGDLSRHPSSTTTDAAVTGRILVVGGDSIINQRLGRALGMAGFAVIFTASGTEAIFLYHQGACDVVLCDVALADMPGTELLKAIKAMDEEAQVIFMTAYASLEGVLEALRAGARDYLLHPAEDPGPLLTALNGAMGRIRTLKYQRGLVDQLKRETQSLAQTNARLQKMANCDALTELFNRRHFQAALCAEIERCQRYPDIFSLLFMDLDNFKIYNDINGHVAGDALLKSLARMLLTMFRKTDTLARFGGDEFVAILPQTTMPQALALGEKICHQVAATPFKGLSRLPGKRVTISIGCAIFPHDGATSQDLIQRADQTLYKSKSTRNGRVA